MTGWIRPDSDDSWLRGQPRRQGDSPRQEPSAPPAKPIQRAREPIDDVVDFVSTRCPACKSTKNKITSTKRIAATVVERYHRCVCGRQFKSHEKQP